MASNALEDRLAVRELVERYAGAVTRRDAATWADSWADDAHWHIVQREAHGRANIVALWQELMAPFPFVIHYVTATGIETTGDRGRGSWSVLEMGKMADGTDVMMAGRYEDEYVKCADGRWRFASRRYEFLNMLTGVKA